MVKCPGQDQRFWKPGDIFEISCPSCGGRVEFFKDEPELKCRGCGQRVVNPKIDLGCAQWCQYADRCLAVSVRTEANVLRDNLIEDMKAVFGEDRKRIDHALSVLGHAEQIQAVEGGEPLVVKAAAILHDIGILEAERKHGSSAGRYQEIEGPPIARKILENYNLDGKTVEHICKIIANHHSARDIDTLEFRIVWDADWLVNMYEEFPAVIGEELQRHMNKILKTSKGRLLAVESLIEDKKK